MNYSSRVKTRATRGTRATRVGLQGRITAVVLLENGRQLPAKLHSLSVTGGLLEVSMYLEERSKVGLTLPIGTSIVRPSAEMLFPMCGAGGYLQPFRFEHLWAEERQKLEAEIEEILRQSAVRSNALPPRTFDLESL
jgi:hypothetical protein